MWVTAGRARHCRNHWKSGSGCDLAEPGCENSFAPVVVHVTCSFAQAVSLPPQSLCIESAEQTCTMYILLETPSNKLDKPCRTHITIRFSLDLSRLYSDF